MKMPPELVKLRDEWCLKNELNAYVTHFDAWNACFKAMSKREVILVEALEYYANNQFCSYDSRDKAHQALEQLEKGSNDGDKP